MELDLEDLAALEDCLAELRHIIEEARGMAAELEQLMTSGRNAG